MLSKANVATDKVVTCGAVDLLSGASVRASTDSMWVEVYQDAEGYLLHAREEVDAWLLSRGYRRTGPWHDSSNRDGEPVALADVARPPLHDVLVATSSSRSGFTARVDLTPR